jgi:cell division protease FtsH
MELIDEEVAKILHQSAEQSQNMLMEHRSELDKLAEALLEEEELDDKQITELIGPSAQRNGEKDGSDEDGSGEDGSGEDG